MLKKTKITIIILVTIIFLLAFLKIFNVKEKILKEIYPIKYSEYVEQYSKEQNLDSLIIYSIIKAESNFNQTAQSSSGATGLMQLMDATAMELANEFTDEAEVQSIDLTQPEINIKLGVSYYAKLLEKYNDNMLLALTAYNAGIGNVDNWIEQGIIKSDGSDIENIPYKETNMYVRKIINNYKMYTKLYNS